MSRILVALLLLWSTAWAEPPQVVIVSGPQADEQVTALKWALRRVVDSRDNMRLLALDDLIGGGAAAGTMALERGIEALENLDFGAASTSLRLAALNLAGHARHKAEATQALYHLGRAQMALRDNRRAETTFALLFRLDPSFDPPPGTASPSNRRAMSAGGQRANQTKNGSLDVTWKDGAAAVFLDGVYRGMTPAAFPTLSAGPHHVRLTVDGSADTLEVIEVSHRKKKTVVGRHRALAKSTLWRRVMTGLADDPPDVDALRNLAAMTGGRQAILLVEDGDDGVVALLYDLPRQARVRRVEVDRLEDPSSGAQVLDELYTGLDPEAANMLASADLAAEGSEWDTRWLLWSAAGLGLVAAVVVPIVLFSDDEQRGLDPTPGTGAVIVRY